MLICECMKQITLHLFQVHVVRVMEEFIDSNIITIFAIHYRTLTVHLALFSKFSNPKSVHGEPRLNKLYHEVCSIVMYIKPILHHSHEVHELHR